MTEKDLSEFSDVLSSDVKVEQVTALEFEFDNYIFRRELNHWEIQFESENGEEAIIVEREDFVAGKLEFDIDGNKEVFLLEEFDRIEQFAYDKKLI